MDLGNKLLKLRKISKMTQEEVAEKLDITRQTVSNWELNQTKPDLEQAIALTKLYKISLDDLIENDTKDILSQRVSNTEKLAGLVYKILKVLIFLFIGFWLFMIVFIVLGMVLFRINSEATNIETQVNIICDLKGVKYDINLVERNNRMFKINGAGELEDILDLNSYTNINEVLNVVVDYIELNGGSCE